MRRNGLDTFVTICSFIAAGASLVAAAIRLWSIAKKDKR